MPQHLTFEEREVLSQMRFAGHSAAAIARQLNRHRSTICRELARNGGADGRYRAVAAQRAAELRRQERPRIKKLDRPEMRTYVVERLQKYWSPDQIAGRSQLDFRQPKDQLSRTTIYTWLYADDHTEYWQRYLRSWSWKTASRRGQIPHTSPIADRPTIIERRKRYGDWEGDTIVGSRQTGGLLSLVERKSGYLLLTRLERRLAEPVAAIMGQRLGMLPKRLRRSITCDNGKEFAAHKTLTKKLKLPVYFAAPGCPWQRGTNENTNGLVRQFFPKKSHIQAFNEQEISDIETQINERPRRRLGYQTPSEKLQCFLVANET